MIDKKNKKFDLEYSLDLIEDLNRIELLIQNDKKQMSLDLLKYIIEDIKIILKG
jgi:hypothetical protein